MRINTNADESFKKLILFWNFCIHVLREFIAVKSRNDRYNFRWKYITRIYDGVRWFTVSRVNRDILPPIAEEIAGRSAIYSRPTLILQPDARAFAGLAAFPYLNSQPCFVDIKDLVIFKQTKNNLAIIYCGFFIIKMRKYFLWNTLIHSIKE